MDFEDCSAFTDVTACTLAESPGDPLPKAPAVPLPPLLPRLLPGGANQFPGGTQLPLNISAFARRTRTIPFWGAFNYPNPERSGPRAYG